MLFTLVLWNITEWIPNILINIHTIIDLFKELFL